jgi:hypothetical protein
MRKHLSYANVMATLAFLIAVAGGTAYAADTIGSSDIINEAILSEDLKNGEVGTVDIGTNQVLPPDVRNERLTGVDIKDQSGVDTCVAATTRIGQLCFRAENADRDWNQALEFCAGLDLRLPSAAEAVELALTHDLPNVGTAEDFWTDELIGQEVQEVVLVDDDGTLGSDPPAALKETACVTTPTN